MNGNVCWKVAFHYICSEMVDFQTQTPLFQALQSAIWWDRQHGGSQADPNVVLIQEPALMGTNLGLEAQLPPYTLNPMNYEILLTSWNSMSCFASSYTSTYMITSKLMYFYLALGLYHHACNACKLSQFCSVYCARSHGVGVHCYFFVVFAGCPATTCRIGCSGSCHSWRSAFRRCLETPIIKF